jgi:hypothetical protein
VDLFFKNIENGIIVGYDHKPKGIILQTTDGGLQWIKKEIGQIPFLEKVYFTDYNTGYIIGGGIILHTTDGGETWIEGKKITHQTLRGIHFANKNVGIIIGDNGVILKTTTGGITSVKENRIQEITPNYHLYQNYPNPFNPSTVISFQLPVFSHVKLIIYDILGREVTKLIDEDRLAGYHSITWNAKNVASGLYYYKLMVNGANPLTAGNYVQVRKMILLK